MSEESSSLPSSLFSGAAFPAAAATRSGSPSVLNTSLESSDSGVVYGAVRGRGKEGSRPPTPRGHKGAVRSASPMPDTKVHRSMNGPIRTRSPSVQPFLFTKGGTASGPATPRNEGAASGPAVPIVQGRVVGVPDIVFPQEEYPHPSDVPRINAPFNTSRRLNGTMSSGRAVQEEAATRVILMGMR